MPAEAGGHRGLRQFRQTYGLLLLALFAECIVFEVVAQVWDQKSFLTAASAINVLNQSVEFGILAVGMTFVILTGGIDLSVGSLVAFGGVVCAKVIQGREESVWAWIILAWAAALLVGLAVGGLAGATITWLDVPPFIATLAMMSSLRGLGYILAEGHSISGLPDAYTVLGRHRLFGYVPVGVVVMLAVFMLGAVVLNLTRFGRHVRAIGGAEESARLSGVPVTRVKCAVYCLSGMLAVLGGLIGSSKIGSGDPNSGMGYELNVIAAVVVGGTSLAGGRGTIGGTFIGLLIVSVLGSGLNWVGVETFGQQVVLGIVIFAAVLLDRIKGK